MMKTQSLYEPAMRLLKATDGFVLQSVIYVANSCIKENGHVKQLPPGTVVLPEALPISLNLRSAGDVCLPVVSPVIHQVPLTAKDLEGRLSIVAFAVLEGAVLGASSIPVDLDSLKTTISIQQAGGVTTAGVMPWPGI